MPRFKRRVTLQSGVLPGDQVKPVPVAAPRSYCTRAAWLLGVGCFLIYLGNLRQMPGWDCIPARMLPFSILQEGNFDLDEFTWLRHRKTPPHFLRQGHDRHWYSSYPIGTPVLVTPLYIPVAWWRQHYHIDNDDVRFRLASVVMERVAAALVTAVSVSLVFLAATAVTSRRGATGAALVYGLGTNTWAISSQVLWQHGAAELGLAGMSLCLMLPDRRGRAVAAGGFAALAVLARPPMLIFALVALLFIWRERRGQLVLFLIFPIIGATLLCAYALHVSSIATGPVAANSFTVPHLARMTGLLVSPNRGLFVYTPLTALAVPALWRLDPTAPRWLAYAPIGIAGYLVLLSTFVTWWGGYCYGPRYLTDLLPILVLCAAGTVRRLWGSQHGRVLVATLALWGVVVQVIGVYCDDEAWNAWPEPVDVAPWRVWDWTDPQIVRAAHSGWHGFDSAPFLWHSLLHSSAAELKPLVSRDLAAELTSPDRLPLHYRASSTGRLRLRITNLSEVRWPAFADYGYLYVSVAYRWRHDGTVVQGEGGFIPLPWNLDARESATIRSRIKAPAYRGSYQLELMVTQLLDAEKGVVGDAVLRMPVEIE
jgi:hypothetical protein